MADNPGEFQLAMFIKALSPYAPGAAGVLLSLAFGEGLTLRGKAVSGLGGGASVVWGAPAICWALDLILAGDGVPVVLANLVGFLTGLFAMIIITGLAKALATYAADPLKLVRVKLGPVEIGGEGG